MPRRATRTITILPAPPPLSSAALGASLAVTALAAAGFSDALGAALGDSDAGLASALAGWLSAFTAAAAGAIETRPSSSSSSSGAGGAIEAARALRSNAPSSSSSSSVAAGASEGRARAASCSASKASSSCRLSVTGVIPGSKVKGHFGPSAGPSSTRACSALGADVPFRGGGTYRGFYANAQRRQREGERSEVRCFADFSGSGSLFSTPLHCGDLARELLGSGREPCLSGDGKGPK